MERSLDAVPCKHETTGDVRRRLPIYEPNIWGDRFLHYTSPDEETKSQLEQELNHLKEKVREKLLGAQVNPMKMVALIDDIQRLGVAYHFEKEIEINLQNLNMHHDDKLYEDDLHYVSLLFRLLRQLGFYASSEVFEKFTHENGNFKDALKNDVQGMLNLYEASHLRVHGESNLEEALTFTTTQLSTCATHVDTSLAELINHALEIPLHKRCTRFESKYYISMYESLPSHDMTLLKFAKLDFNLLQSLHKEEVRDICRWSRSLNLSSKLPFVRDRTVEAYYWILGVYYEPRYAFARAIVNKIFNIANILDDTYDTYGTIEELEIFTQAIQRWDKSCLNQLPDYMKFIYQKTLDTVQELEKELMKEGRSFAMDYMKREIKALCDAYLQEARWCHENYVPTYEEYMRNGIVTAGYFYMITASILGMGNATKEVFEWIRQSSNAVISANAMARIMNDIVSHQFERSNGQVASAVECYMAQYEVTLETAYDKLQQKAQETWKDVNNEMIQPTSIPMSFFMRVLNLCRVLYDVYHVGEDGYTLARPLQPKIEAILIDRFTL